MQDTAQSALDPAPWHPATGLTEVERLHPDVLDDCANTIIKGCHDELLLFADDELALMQPETRARMERVMKACEGHS